MCAYLASITLLCVPCYRFRLRNKPPALNVARVAAGFRDGSLAKLLEPACWLRAGSTTDSCFSRSRSNVPLRRLNKRWLIGNYDA